MPFTRCVQVRDFITGIGVENIGKRLINSYQQVERLFNNTCYVMSSVCRCATSSPASVLRTSASA
jgi:hypothetical protein